MVFALEGPIPLILSNSDWVAVLTLIGDAVAGPREEITNAAAKAADLIKPFAIPIFKYLFINSPVVNKKSTDTKCAWIFYNEKMILELTDLQRIS